MSKKLESLTVAGFAKLEEASKQSSMSANALDRTLWKDIASRQLALRRAAEADNAKLRKDVVFQEMNAANLKRMLKRRYSEEMLEMMPIEKRARKVAAKVSADNERVFRELLEGTDLIYAGVDALLAKKCMAELSCPSHTLQAYPKTVNGLLIELIDKNQVPFSSPRTADAVWKALCGRKPRDGDIVDFKMCVEDMQQTEDLTSYMSYTCNAAGHSSFVQEKRVGRKYVEDERVVFVYRGLTEPSSRSLGCLGLLFRETVVIVVRKGQTLASGDETALIESYLWVNRCDDGKDAALKFRDATFVDIAIEGWSKKLSLYSERIENILFDDALNAM